MTTASTRATAAQPDQRDLLDEDGENRAVRTFLMQYGAPGLTIGAMRSHMTRSGWGEEVIPPFARSAYSAEHLTKAGAQIWIRHLFSLEQHSGNPASTGREDRPVAMVRVTHGGYGMELSTYIAYALPEGMHDLYAAPVAAPELDVEAERRELMRAFEREYLPLKTNSLDKIIKRRAELAAFEKGWLAARTAATSTAPAKLDAESERRDAARYRYIEEHATTHGGGNGFTITCFIPFDEEDMGCGIDSAIAATSTQAARAPGEAKNG